jgi:hypothetical protein
VQKQKLNLAFVTARTIKKKTGQLAGRYDRDSPARLVVIDAGEYILRLRSIMQQLVGSPVFK